MSVSQQTGAPLLDADLPRGRGAELRRLVLAHQNGDAYAFATLVRLTFPSMFRHAQRRLFDARAAEDAVQEALLRAYRSLPALRGDYQVAAWLHRILANVCSDEGNRRRREAQVNGRLSAEPAYPMPSAEDTTGRADVARTVAAAIATLPASYREALVLRDILELEYSDVASRAGISEDNARARVHRARAALRRLVDSSALLGGMLLGAARRLSRASVDSAQHVSVSVSTMPPEVLTAPSRISAAATSVAAAAIAVAAAVPVFTASVQTPGSKHSAQASAPVIRVTAGPTTGSQTMQVEAAAAVPTTASTVLALSETTTTVPSPSEKQASLTATTPPHPDSTSTAGTATDPGASSGPAPLVTAPPPAPGPSSKPAPIWASLRGTLTLTPEPQTGETHLGGVLSMTGLPGGAVDGKTEGVLDPPADGSCLRTFLLRFTWTGATGNDDRLTLRGSAVSDANGAIRFYGELSPDGRALQDGFSDGAFTGRLRTDSAGVNGSLDADLRSGATPPSAPTCPNDPGPAPPASSGATSPPASTDPASAGTTAPPSSGP